MEIQEKFGEGLGYYYYSYNKDHTVYVPLDPSRKNKVFESWLKESGHLWWKVVENERT